MPPPNPILTSNPGAAIPGTILGGAQTVVSLINAHKAKEEAKNLAKTRPKREIYKGYGENLSLAESELAGGMSTAAENAYNAVLDREQSGSLSAILRGGGDVNNVADVFAAGEEGRQRLAMLTDQLRLKQIDNVMKSRETMGDEVAKNFFWNESKPWEDKAAANAEARKSANQGIWSGLSTLTGGISTMMGSGGNQSSQTNSPTVIGRTGSASDSSALVPQQRQPNSGSDSSGSNRAQNNFSGTDSTGDFQVPDYMNDPMWWQKI